MSKFSPQLKLRILRTTDGCCWYCGKDLTHGGIVHLDHVEPLIKGGPDIDTNLVPACQRCNHSKRSRDLEEFRRYVAKANGYYFTRLQRLIILREYDLDIDDVVNAFVGKVLFWAERTDCGLKADDGVGDFWPPKDSDNGMG